MQYVALLFLVLSMQQLCAMDMRAMPSMLRNSAQFAQQAARTMSPEALAAIRQSSSSVLPHLALTPAVQFAAFKHAASMGQQQSRDVPLLKTAQTGAKYVAKGLWFSGSFIVSIIKQFPALLNILKDWAGILSFGTVVAGGFVYLSKQVYDARQDIQAHRQETRVGFERVDGRLQRIGEMVEEQGVLLDDIEQSLDNVGDDVVQLSKKVDTGFAGVGSQLGILTTEQVQQGKKIDTANQNIAAHRQETGKGFNEVNEFVAIALEKIDALQLQITDLGVAHGEQNKEYQKELAQLREEVKSGNINVTDRIVEIESKINSAGENVQKQLTDLNILAASNHAELLAAIERRQLLPASSSQPPLLITNVSPPRDPSPSPRSRSPLPSRIQNHMRRSPSPPPLVRLPDGSSDARPPFIDLPFGKNDFRTVLKERGSPFLMHNGGGSSHTLRLMDNRSK